MKPGIALRESVLVVISTRGCLLSGLSCGRHDDNWFLRDDLFMIFHFGCADSVYRQPALR